MDLPTACTLTSGDYAVRTTQLADLSDLALRSRTPIPGGERLTFAHGADIERRLRDAIAAEAECCSFLRMELPASNPALPRSRGGFSSDRRERCRRRRRR